MIVQPELKKEICEALGLTEVKRLTLTLEVEKIVTVEAEMYMLDEAGKKLVTILKRYELVEKKS